ncbi:MAG: Glu-tRNA(Gln) amidotransferase subunit GatE [Bacteroidales bacterium]|nr:Glu-tRNA(Gln) amidotransferase subunit GatE [Bacteroidales bacterium]
MKKKFDPLKNYKETQKEIGYVKRKDATQKTYDAIGFMSGLEVHQQLDTKTKLFCNCPAGLFQKMDEYDAEVIRHMRPTLSELGEYDGTALMEFKTKKNIVYRIKNETTCTYEVDDTPPFPVNKDAVEKAIEISLLSKLNIVGEIHITRKQYLDGSIPTGFQRTAIIGVEGEIPLKNKKVRLIQLSLEEDSCREVSDIGHTRIYRTDRLGMPLIETVTYPDMTNPDEVMEAANYIRFLNRSTGKVRTGIGAGREDVNVSCKGGTRVEIKGVSHNKWIPELTHNECFRQWALLIIREKLKKRIKNHADWKITHAQVNYIDFKFKNKSLKEAFDLKHKFVAVNLPGFQGILSHFTQPGKSFSDEISERIKVIACIEMPHMTHSEDLKPIILDEDFEKIKELLHAQENDAQLLIWGPSEDINTALETIEERCLWAFAGVPNETRKSFKDGTTIFERVLPGADRMYPDTDSAPIPLSDEYIENIRKRLPTEIVERYKQLKEWQVPEDTYTYIFSKNLYPLIKKIITDLNVNPRFAGSFLGHTMKFVEGHYKPSSQWSYELVYDLFKFLKEKNINYSIMKYMLPHLYQHPKMDFDSILNIIKFKKITAENIKEHIPFFKEKFYSIRRKKDDKSLIEWIMGELRMFAAGNMNFNELHQLIEKEIGKSK